MPTFKKYFTRWTVALILLTLGVGTYADTPSSVSYTTFTSGTTISASSMNTNFSTTKTALDGLLGTIFVKTDGTVGIGNTSPGSKLVIKGAGATSATRLLQMKLLQMFYLLLDLPLLV